MICERFVNGRARSNAYLYAPASGAEALVVDPGTGSAPKLLRRVRELGLRPVAVLLTHGHPDHMWMARPLAATLDVPVYADRRDWRWFDDPLSGGHLPVVRACAMAWTRLRPLRPADLLSVEPETMVGSFRVNAIHTPGHTPGSTTFLAGDVCFVGDTVFAGGLGHTSYPGGDAGALRASIRTLLETVGEGVRVLPGHGGETSVGRVRELLTTKRGR